MSLKKMKRATCLFEQIIDYQNIRLAYLKARKKKQNKQSVKNFNKNINKNLQIVQKNLSSNPPILSKYSQFTIFDPKERVISVVPFLDRVMHHAIMNVLEPVFEKQFVFHTYACRKGKGAHKAVLYAHKKAKQCKYFLKLDIKKFFDNINHSVLKNALNKIIKDKKCLNLLQNIIDSYGITFSSFSMGGQGLPIGNLTSQFFANFYMSALDHFVLEKLKPCGFVRYMDDFIIFDSCKEKINNIFVQINDFCTQKLFLTLKPAIKGSCKNGFTFLGYFINHQCIKLSQNSKKRKLKKLKRINFEFEKGTITQQKYCARVKCLYSIPCIMPYLSQVF